MSLFIFFLICEIYCTLSYRSALLEDLPDEISSIPEDALYLNKRFAGLGLLPALGVEVHHALPYHPQSKSIEWVFGTLEREWICKLKGWCHNSAKERPDGFSKRLQQLLGKKELLTMDAFVQIFQSEILPGYHQLSWLHFRQSRNQDGKMAAFL